MNYSCQLNFPHKTLAIFRIIWLILALGSVLSLIVLGYYVQSLLALLMVLAGYLWQLKQFRQEYNLKTRIHFYNECWFISQGGFKEPVEILASTRLLPYWIVLNYKLQGKKNNLVIFKDMLSDEDFRDLSRNLRFSQARPITSKH